MASNIFGFLLPEDHFLFYSFRRSGEPDSEPLEEAQFDHFLLLKVH